MLNSFLSFFNSIKSSDDILEDIRKPNNVVKNKVVYRDELISKKKFSKKKRMIDAEFGNSEERRNDSSSSAEKKGTVIRVKVKMTKQEAARMLSKCKNGGLLHFKDVAHDLTHIPMGRVTVEPSSTSAPATCCAATPVLKTIPEDLYF